jgi:hypothetical protein
MAITLTIGGTDRSEYVAAQSLNIASVLSARDDLRFTTHDEAGVYKPGVGQEVIVEDGDTRLFAGTVDSVVERLQAGTTVLYCDCQCVDSNQLCDRLLVADIYESTLAGDIVADLIVDYLAAEGVLGTRTGATFTRATTAYKLDGTAVGSGEARYEDAASGFGKAVMVQKGATNIVPSSYGLMTVDTDADGVVDGFTKANSNSTCVYSLDGGQKITLAGLTLASAYGQVSLVSNRSAVTPGQSYTFSVDAKLARTAAEIVDLYVTWYTAGGGAISSVALTNQNPGTSYARLTLTGTAPATAATANPIVRLRSTAITDTGSAWFRHAMFEQRAYATSFHETTRNAEVLTSPKAGAFSDSEGSLQKRIKPLRSYGTNHQYIFDGGGAANHNLQVYIDSTTGKPTLVYGDGAADVTITSSGSAVVSGTHYGIGWKWSSAGVTLLVNGVSVGTDATAPDIVFGATVYWGCEADGTLQFDGLIYDDRASVRARTAAEFLADHNTGLPLPVDQWTTSKMPFNSALTATTQIQDGLLLTKAVFNYRTVTEAFNELAELSGYSWNIDHYKVMHFFARETNYASTAITGANARNFSARTTRDQYRNRQYVRAGYALTAERTESFVGDGTRKVFTLAFPCGKVPSAVTVDGTPKTIGIREVETGKDWYWQKGETTISQDDAAGALGGAEILAVTYQGLYPLIVDNRNSPEIAARQAVEGGTGLYEAIEDEPDYDDDSLAIDKSNALLRKYGRINKTVVFETDETGFRAGQLVSITLSELGLSGFYLISQVTIRDVTGLGDLRHVVTALDGEDLGGWIEFYRKLAAAGQKFVIRENEVLVTLRYMEDELVCGDELTVSTGLIRFPGTAVDDASVGTQAWENPGNVCVDDDAAAVTEGAILATTYSHYLKASSFGFNIPSGATIYGIEVAVSRHETQAIYRVTYDNILRLLKDGVVVGNDKADTGSEWPETFTLRSYGALDDLWGIEWTPSDINAVGFGVVLSVKDVSSVPNVAQGFVDYIKITVYYRGA